jgi:nucleoside-diphosphate-sugar epimerase
LWFTDPRYLVDGTGSGLVNQRSLQIPALIKVSIQKKQPVVLGEGTGIWTFVHVSDVAAFYQLLLDRHLSGKNFDTGMGGYYFLEAGETTWREISQRIAQAGRSLGRWLSEELEVLTTQEMTDALGIPFLNASMVEVIWGSK